MAPDFRNALVVGLGQWLKLMCAQGEPFRRHVALAFAPAESPAELLRATADKSAPLAAMLCKHTTLTAGAQKLWHDVWLSLIADSWFKKQVRCKLDVGACCVVCVMHLIHFLTLYSWPSALRLTTTRFAQQS